MTNLERFTTQEYADQFEIMPARRYYGSHAQGSVVLHNSSVAVHLHGAGSGHDTKKFVKDCVATFRADRAEHFPGLPL